MTEEEVLQKMDLFKNAIVELKEKVASLEKANAELSMSSSSYNLKIEQKISEIENLLKEEE